MTKTTKTKLQIACNQIPGYFEVTQMLQQYILINGLSQATFSSYSRKLVDLALYFNKLPEHITEDELREYLAILVQQAKSNSKTEFKHTVYSMRFYFRMLGKPMTVSLPKIKEDKNLPVVLSKQECLSLIELTKNFKHRLILMFIYGAGLRVRELTNLKWSDINVNRMMIHIKQSKGRRDRYVPLAKTIVGDFVNYMLGFNRSEYVFFGPDCNGKMSHSGIQFLLKQAVRRAGINKTGVCLHTLRHSYATHLLEDGLDIISIKELLGHERIETTLVYLHVANCTRNQKMSPLDTLFGEVAEDDLNKFKEKYNELSVLKNSRMIKNENQLRLFES
jgi:site-specific recombinase XerD